jgi:hypothetical protein
LKREPINEEAVKILTEIAMISDGILPFFKKEDIEKALSQFSPDDRRKLVRKYRKIWRKLRNPLVHEFIHGENEQISKKEKKRITHLTREYRRRVVHEKYQNKEIKKLLEEQNDH